VHRLREATPRIQLGAGFSTHLRTHRQHNTVKSLRAYTAARDVEDLAKQLTVVLDAYGLGLIDAESFAWQVGNIGARLGVLAARGDLRPIA
jgi:hypothetical protein